MRLCLTANYIISQPELHQLQPLKHLRDTTNHNHGFRLTQKFKRLVIRREAPRGEKANKTRTVKERTTLARRGLGRCRHLQMGRSQGKHSPRTKYVIGIRLTDLNDRPGVLDLGSTACSRARTLASSPRRARSEATGRHHVYTSYDCSDICTNIVTKK